MRYFPPNLNCVAALVSQTTTDDRLHIMTIAEVNCAMQLQCLAKIKFNFKDGLEILI